MAHHNHPCRHCRKNFLCGEDATECFQADICCDPCYWRVEVKWFALVLILGGIAIWMTLFIAENYKPNEHNGTGQPEKKISVPAEKPEIVAPRDSR